MGPESALQVVYPPFADLRQHPADWWQDVLAVIDYGHAGIAPPLLDIPRVEVMTPVLGQARSALELWRLPGPMASGRRGRVSYRGNGRLLFAALSLPEHEFAQPATQEPALRRATQAAYTELFSALEALGFPHPLRIWNFLPDINCESGGQDRYWQFNDARQDVFLAFNRDISGNVPAASALGSHTQSPLTVYCIASATAPIALENPRQRSAWDYPPQYSPRRPTFSRACIEGGAAQTLFISGTASIVGHESTHTDDVAAQTRETLHNIRALLTCANERIGHARYALERLHYKAYVRRPDDLPSIVAELRHVIGTAVPVLYLKADICRRDLLIEIEAVGT